MQDSSDETLAGAEAAAGSGQDDLEKMLTEDRFRALRAAVSALTLLAFALPWVWEDGAGSATSGGRLLAYTFMGPERGEWVRHSFIGAMSLTVLPWMALAFTVSATMRCIQGNRAVILHTLAAASTLLIMLTAGGITSTGHRWGSLIQPGFGMLILLLGQGGLAVLAWKYWWEDRQRETDWEYEDGGEAEEEDREDDGSGAEPEEETQ